jgi:MFS transporter, ACS family, hexuronate transporter
LRWWIAGLLALATALNYLDRQSFPVVVSEIKKEIPISTEQFARITQLFLLAYGIMYAVGGRILDWLGTRMGYAVMIVWWSAATFLTGTASSVLGLGVFRFLLGMGEGGGFPGSGKAVAEWFPARERSLAFGTFNAGSSIGAMIAPPLIAVIVHHLGWRWVFFITGSIGFVWVWIWLRLYERPSKNKLISPEERDYILSNLQQESKSDERSSPSDNPPMRWRDLFRHRQVWGLMLAKFLTDSAWYFFIFWLPKYLADIRGLDIKQIGYFAWIPYALSGVGSLLGGWIGTFLIRRNFSLDLARKIALGVGASLMPASLLIAAAPLSYAIIFFGLAMFAHQFWSSNVQTLPADIFSSRIVGSVEGLLGSAGSFGGILFAQLAARIVGEHGYGPVFIAAGLLHPLAFIVILATVPRIRRIS